MTLGSPFVFIPVFVLAVYGLVAFLRNLITLMIRKIGGPGHEMRVRRVKQIIETFKVDGRVMVLDEPEKSPSCGESSHILVHPDMDCDACWSKRIKERLIRGVQSDVAQSPGSANAD